MPLPDDVQAQLVDAYQRDEPVSAIIAVHRIGRATLYRVLRDHGVELERGFHGRPKGWTDGELARVAEMRRSGASKEQIRVAFGTNHARVDRALRRVGLLDTSEAEPELPSVVDRVASGVPVERDELLKLIRPG